MAAELHSVAEGETFDVANSLLQCLVPRARSFSLYDSDRTCIWNSEGTDDFEVDHYEEILKASEDELRRTEELESQDIGTDLGNEKSSPPPMPKNPKK